MISTKYNFIFVHIYKTAGTSVAQALSRGNMAESAARRYSYRIGRYRHLKKHSKATDYAVTIENFHNYYSFSFVRNPFDWLVSLYEYGRKNKKHQEYGFMRGLDFSGFVKWWVVHRQETQSSFLCDCDGNIIVDFVGNYETINKDFHFVRAHLGLKDKGLAVANRSSRRKTHEYFNTQLVELVADKYKDDFVRFKYSYDPRKPEPQIA